MCSLGFFLEGGVENNFWVPSSFMSLSASVATWRGTWSAHLVFEQSLWYNTAFCNSSSKVPPYIELCYSETINIQSQYVLVNQSRTKMFEYTFFPCFFFLSAVDVSAASTWDFASCNYLLIILEQASIEIFGKFANAVKHNLSTAVHPYLSCGGGLGRRLLPFLSSTIYCWTVRRFIVMMCLASLNRLRLIGCHRSGTCFCSVCTWLTGRKKRITWFHSLRLLRIVISRSATVCANIQYVSALEK